MTVSAISFMKPNTWDTDQVKDIMYESGYSADDVIECSYSHTNTMNQAVFNTVYYDMGDGEVTNAPIYIFVDIKGNLSVDF